MKPFLTLLVLLLSLCVKAQDVPVPVIFSDAVRSLGDTSAVAYLDSSMTFYKPLSQLADKYGRVYGNIRVKEKPTTSLRFTKTELRDADRKMDRRPSIQWPPALLPGSRRLTSDSLPEFTSYMYAREFRRQGGRYRFYYYFSQPILLKAGTLAVFRLAAMVQHSAGYDYLFFYEKRENKWQRKMTVRAGAW